MGRIRKGLKWLAAAAVAVFIIACATPYLFPVPTNSAALEGPFDNSRVQEIDGVRIHYRTWDTPSETPAGRAVLIHGFSGSTFSWRKNIQTFLRMGYDVIAVDVPPFGYSDKRTDIDTAAGGQGALFWELIDTLEDPNLPTVLVGHSMGGGIIASMAALAPERVDSLVFVAGAVSNRPEGSGNRAAILLPLFQFPPVVRWVEVIAHYMLFTPDYIAGLLESAYGEPPDSGAVSGYLDALQTPGTARAIWTRMRGAGGGPRPDPSAIEAPALLLWGSEDTWVPVRAGERLDERLPRSELYILEGAGHCPMETHPDEFNDRITVFLSQRIESAVPGI